MKKIMIGAFVALGFGMTACGGGIASKFNSLADQVCACKDQACLDEVEKKAEGMVKDMMASMKSEPSESDIKAIEAAMERGEKCASKIKGGGDSE
jgi:hypothetical protein